MPTAKYNIRFKKGIAALPTILLISGIIVEISVAGVLVAYFFGQSGFGIKLSAEALSAANAGVSDALIKIVRDKKFFHSGYNLTVGRGQSYVVVCRESCISGKREIVSTGSVLTKRRKIQAIVNVNDTTGEVKIESIKEIPL